MKRIYAGLLHGDGAWMLAYCVAVLGLCGWIGFGLVVILDRVML